MHVESLHWLICAGFAFIWIIVTIVVRDRVRRSSKGPFPSEAVSRVESEGRSIQPDRPYVARGGRAARAIPQASSASDIGR